jgi:hypothetical protein
VNWSQNWINKKLDEYVNQLLHSKAKY